MAQEHVKCDGNSIFSEKSSNIRERYDYLGNKVNDSETTININSFGLDSHTKYKKIQDKIFSLDDINTKLLSFDENTISDNVKSKDEIYFGDIKIEFNNEQLFCKHCHEYYEDYCTKCRMLVHILNKRTRHNTDIKAKQELPNYILETRVLTGDLRIFTLKDIPEGVRLGPFTEINSSEFPLKIKGGRFIVNDRNSIRLNWMQYIHFASDISKQNLLPFQYEDKLYYRSTRRIQEGEELLVYFGKEYNDNLNKCLEIGFIPIEEKIIDDVFACTFCCLGFSSKEHLVEHKTACLSETNEISFIEELAQCLFCKIYFEKNEYLEYHMDNCWDKRDRHIVLPASNDDNLEVKRRSCVTNKRKKMHWEIYKCTKCKYKAKYKADFKDHSNKHYEVKKCKCGICYKRFKRKESLKVHVLQVHIGIKGKIKKYSTCDYLKVHVRNIRSKKRTTQTSEKELKCTKCIFQTNNKYHLDSHIKSKHLEESNYKCVNCEYNTNCVSNLQIHMTAIHLKETNYNCTNCEFMMKYWRSLEMYINTKHLKESDYQCIECEYKTKYKYQLKRHIKTIHLKESPYKRLECEHKTNSIRNLERRIKKKQPVKHDYKCMECEYKTNKKDHLKRHTKTVHLKEQDYGCMECEYKSNFKKDLDAHIKIKHLKICDYKCPDCEYKTNSKSHMKVHNKTQHLREHDYKCLECEYKTNNKSHLKTHVKTRHVKVNDYKCMECKFETNYRSHLEKHTKAKHLKEHDYKCLECEYKTNYKSHLKTHIKTIHLKVIDYKCMECEFKTNNRSHFEIHLKGRHLKEHDYKCTECEFKTSYKSSLCEHMRTQHL